MKSKIELTATQLAGLDLIIASKVSPMGFLNDIAHAAVQVAQVAVAVAEVVAVVGLANPPHPDPTGLKGIELAKKTSLDDLLKIRYGAIQKS